MTETDLMLPNGPGWELVPISNIQYIQSNRKLCTIVTVKAAYTISASLRSFLQRLPPSQFIRIHKSYIIALSHVHFIGKTHLQVAGRSLPITPRAKTALKS